MDTSDIIHDGLNNGSLIPVITNKNGTWFMLPETIFCDDMLPEHRQHVENLIQSINDDLAGHRVTRFYTYHINDNTANILRLIYNILIRYATLYD